MLAIEEDMKNLRMEIARLESARDKKKAEHDLQVGGVVDCFGSGRKKNCRLQSRMLPNTSGNSLAKEIVVLGELT